ncbi:MAG: family efflux transporter permease subunit [Candidatus Saccharibacteria bacterium]|nr:family efflux transporter permease subunit [Candidatus Saccharibacteria bacterium]
MTHRQRLTLIATIMGSGIVLIDSTVVNLALPHISQQLHGNFADLQWIVDGYMLSLSSLILLGGSLGDILGRKRIYLIGLSGFGVVSLLCGLAPNMSVLIAMRALQGVFGALLVPGALAIINTNFPQKLRGKAIGQWAAWSGIATAIGPPLGGYIVDALSWRWIFYINIPLVIICYVLAKAGITESKDEYRRTIDYRGAGLAIVALASLTFGLIEGPVHHWNGWIIAILLLGVTSFGLFIVAETHSKDPMVKLDLFASRNFTGANISTFAMYGGLSGFILALVIFLQTGMHYSTFKAGVSLLPITAIMFSLSGRIGDLSAKYGSRIFMTVGPIIAGVGMLSLLNLKPGNSYVGHILPSLLLFGAGLVLTVSPLTITVMSSVSGDESGIASGVNNAISRVAGLIVVAFLGILGAAHVYKFTIVLCSSLAMTAGILAYVLIRNPKAQS